MAFQQDTITTGPKFIAEQILDTLRTSRPVMLDALPATHGIYGLIDHEGEIRYIGVTASPAVGFHNRIFSRHVAGSEGYSHKFSHSYNAGRLWQDRSEAAGAPTADGKIAKRLRAQFCRAYCRAVYYEIAAVEIAGHYFRGLTGLEAQVQALAPASMRLWEGRNFKEMEEPRELVDSLLDDIGASAQAGSAAAHFIPKVIDATRTWDLSFNPSTCMKSQSYGCCHFPNHCPQHRSCSIAI